MNKQQLKSAFAFKNWLRFMGEMFAYAISVMNSIIGRSTMQILLAGANGYVGSLAFADLFFPRFMRAVMSENPELSAKAAEHIAHSQAHWAGIIIMVFLDICIFMFGFMKPVQYKEDGIQRTVNLEPWSKAMAVISAVLGGFGFIEVVVQSGWGWDIKSIMVVCFGFLFSSVAPLLMFQLTRYQRGADGPLVTIIVEWVAESIRENLKNETGATATTLPKPKQQMPTAPAAAPAKSKVMVGETVNFDDFMSQFKN